MTRAWELHDSRISSLRELANSIVIEFTSAYIHESAGVAGFDPGIGGGVPARLELDGGQIECQPTSYPWVIECGALEIDGEEMENIVPLPISARAPVRLDVYKGEELLVITGCSTVRFVETGCRLFREPFDGVR